VYLLVSGTVSLQDVQGGETREIATVATGETFGEAGMHGVQSADLRAVALEDSEVLRLVDGRLPAVFLLIDTITDNY
jgi:CRP-like cAMP-binding protein